MLKISIKDGKTKRVLFLEGKLVAPWTNELTRFSQCPGNDRGKRELIIDVAGVTVISPDGEQALLSLIVQGAKFRGSGVYMRQVLKQLGRRARRNQRVEFTTNVSR